MANAFQKGDLVVLKSGGPPMTIDGLPGESKTYAATGDYGCLWFKGANKERGAFAEHVLEPYAKPSKL